VLAGRLPEVALGYGAFALINTFGMPAGLKLFQEGNRAPRSENSGTTANRWTLKCTVGQPEEVERAATAHLTLAAPDNEKFTVVPRRKSNSVYRSRKHLTEREVERLTEVAKDNRWGHRDATMVLIAFRHGLRASELVDLHWEQIDLEHALLHVRRLKNGSPATHPLTGKELRALRRLQREQELKSPFVFTSERGTLFTKRGFQAMVERAGEAAGFDMKIHPHMLRHACGFKLASDGVDTISATSVRYTELAPTRFKSLFRD
jgi:integrase